MNGLVTARSALPPQAGQIAVGGNTREVCWLEMSANLDDKELGLAYKRVYAEILGSLQDFG
jgi:hypothetical protein